MKVLFDNNIILDIMLARPAFYDNARKLLEGANNGNYEAYITAAATTDIFYIANKAVKDKQKVYEAFETLLSIVRIIPVDESNVQRALELRWKDFEDAVQYTASEANGIDFIVTRNEKDYELKNILSLSPERFLELCVEFK